MTAAGIHSTPRRTAPAAGAYPPAVAALRLAWLYAVSRRVPAALGLLAALGVLLWIALHYHWNIAGGHAAQVGPVSRIQAHQQPGGMVTYRRVGERPVVRGVVQCGNDHAMGTERSPA